MVLLILGQAQFIEVEGHWLMQQELDSQISKLQEQEFKVVGLVQKELKQLGFPLAEPIEKVKAEQALSQFTLIFVAEQVLEQFEQFLKVELQIP